MVAKYKCSECGKKWKSVNSSGSPKQCLSCKGPFIGPYKMRPVKDKDLQLKRKFGKYHCTCGNNWASGNTWVGKWQKCRGCGEEVMPSEIRPLRPGNRFSSTPKPHETTLCEKCIELGYDCRNYAPPQNVLVEDIPDDQSIISEASTASTSSFLDDQQLSDGDITPVGSDNEDFIEKKMKDMNIH